MKFIKENENPKNWFLSDSATKQKKRFVERENVLFAGRENKRENSALLEEEEEKNIRYDKIT